MSKMKSQLCPSLFTDVLRACVNIVGGEFVLEVVDLCCRTVFRCSLGRPDSLRFVQLYAKLSHCLQRPVGTVPVVWHGFLLTSCSLMSLRSVCEILERELVRLSPEGDARAFAAAVMELALWDD